MTYDQVVAAGKVATCQLPIGALLRYEPSEGIVYVLPYPGIPSSWKASRMYDEAIPQDGWMHYLGCVCQYCSAAAPAQPTAAPGVPGAGHETRGSGEISSDL